MIDRFVKEIWRTAFGASDKGEQKVLDVYLDKRPSMVLDKERGTFQEELERFSICQNYQKREIL